MNLSKSFLVLVVLFSIIFAFHQKAFGENWIIYSTSANGIKEYIDKDSVVIISSSVKRVWRKTIMPIEIFLKVSGLPSEDYASYDHSISFNEIDCKKRTTKLLQLIHYGKNGSTIRSIKDPNPEPIFVVPGSVGEDFFKAICR